MGLVVFLFWGIKFSKINRSDINFDWVELVKVVNGDTIQVKINDKTESVRLIGIDAPEITEKAKEKGIEAKKYLEELLENKKIRLEADETQDDRDVYNRLLRYVFLDNGILVNEKMIEVKMAEEYTFIAPYKYQERFRNLEK
jgi:micrococcal nuclease